MADVGAVDENGWSCPGHDSEAGLVERTATIRHIPRVVDRNWRLAAVMEPVKDPKAAADRAIDLAISAGVDAVHRQLVATVAPLRLVLGHVCRAYPRRMRRGVRVSSVEARGRTPFVDRPLPVTVLEGHVIAVDRNDRRRSRDGWGRQRKGDHQPRDDELAPACMPK